MRFDARSKLHVELSGIVLNECGNPQETEEGMASATSKDASSCEVSMESVRMESRLQLKSATTWSKNVIPTLWFKWEVG